MAIAVRGWGKRSVLHSVHIQTGQIHVTTLWKCNPSLVDRLVGLSVKKKGEEAPIGAFVLVLIYYYLLAYSVKNYFYVIYNVVYNLYIVYIQHT